MFNGQIQLPIFLQPNGPIPIPVANFFLLRLSQRIYLQTL